MNFWAVGRVQWTGVVYALLLADGSHCKHMSAGTFSSTPSPSGRGDTPTRPQ
ncbi:hypothetical protein SCLCIDRAFT_1210528 [Scleroderma citrinum Foug A]|uniref:Uncharacterized protein n=1 Tax=Scleroderma citrinum Foug A TaxID=1036808 RepID=A0A0C3E2N1_9AGAM|nr:hypothetical protein SCLCIDRAFT_1210528 [Scleroderma citrinum Foug A]